MKYKKRLFWKQVVCLVLLFLIASFSVSHAQGIMPYVIENRSDYADDQIYIGLTGRVDDTGVWMDFSDSSIHEMQVSDNTVPGPQGTGMYADCFTRLSDIPNQTFNLPPIASTRIFISFGDQLYLHFFGSNDGYSAPDLNNPTDPNQGIRFEIIELTYNSIGLWINTTRVDQYQYPMGLEVWGNDGFYSKVGEILSHEEILAAWQERVPADFQGCYDAALGIIHAPSKTPEFNEGGSKYHYFDAYVNQIWDRYMNEDLTIGTGDAGTWTGRVQSDGQHFVFTRSSDGRQAIVEARPNTQEILEGKGVLAHDVPETPTADDLDVQKHFCAAFNRGAIDPNAPSAAVNDWSNEADFFVNNVYNEYVKFWHQSDISYFGQTYAFCYDDVFDYSSTIHTPGPTNAKITIGGFAGQQLPEIASIDITPKSFSLSPGQTQQFTAIAYDLDGNMISASFRWSANAPGGLFTASSEGQYNVTVSAGGASASAVVTVTGNDKGSITIEAEDYDDMFGINTEPCSEGGEDVGWIDTGDWMQYTLIVPSQGRYEVSFRVAAAGTDQKTLQLQVNGQNIDVDFAGTQGWQNWATVTTNVDLPAGPIPFEIDAVTGDWNINWIKFQYADGQAIALTTIEVSPTSTTLDIGQTQQFTATGHDQYGHVMPISPTWSANAPNAVFAATTSGDFSVTATQDGVTGNANVHVNAAVQNNTDESTSNGSSGGGGGCFIYDMLAD